MAINKAQMLSAIARAENLDTLEQLRVAYLGRKGSVTDQLKSVGALPASERGNAGKLANEIRASVEAALEKATQTMERSALEKELAVPIDVSAPGLRVEIGHRHPVSVV